MYERKIASFSAFDKKKKVIANVSNPVIQSYYKMRHFKEQALILRAKL
jgi:hypothetical protein